MEDFKKYLDSNNISWEKHGDKSIVVEDRFLIKNTWGCDYDVFDLKSEKSYINLAKHNQVYDAADIIEDAFPEKFSRPYIWTPDYCHYSLDKTGKEDTKRYIEKLKMPISLFDYYGGLDGYYDEEYNYPTIEDCERAYKDNLIGWVDKSKIKMTMRYVSWSMFPIWIAVFPEPSSLPETKYSCAKDIWKEYWKSEMDYRSYELEEATKEYHRYD